MYREPHLNEKNKECVELWHEWHNLFEDLEKRHTEETKQLRKKWCKCVDEMSEMVHQEFLTNPRYNNLNK